MRRSIAAALVLTVMAACQPGGALTDEQIAAIAETIDSLQIRAWDAVERVDVEDYLALWHDARETTTVIDGSALTSVSTYEMFLNASGIFNSPATPETALLVFWPSVRNHQVTIGDSRTTVLSPNVAHVAQTGRFVWTDTAGTVWPPRSFVQSTVWVNRDDGWKILFNHYSVPAPEPN
jgi:hypothetical protein